MKFSICIPNYNYGKYIGETILSALDQQGADLEVIVSDNASTDNSVEVVREIQDPRVQLHINRCNVGFAGNLDRAARHATGERMILLSSDDLIQPLALETYKQLLCALGDGGDRAVVCSDMETINGAGEKTGQLGLPRHNVWRATDQDEALSGELGVMVYRVPSLEMLRRCVTTMQNPFHFAATCYPRNLYEEVEGYGGGRLINPDKWFHWKLLSVASDVYFIDRPLFAYRQHGNNQQNQPGSSTVLKLLLDDYMSTFELDGKTLDRMGTTRVSVEKAFIEYNIARHGLATLARGGRANARRIQRFGQAVYPQQMRANLKGQVFRALLAFGPLGVMVARAAYRYRR